MLRFSPFAFLLVMVFATISAFGSEPPPSLGLYQHNWISPFLLRSGGNISGGGEGYRVGNAGRCEIAGIQLVDFARPNSSFLDSFEDLRTEPHLYTGRFGVKTALEGVEVKPSEVAPKSWARALETLARWERNSPVSVALARAKIGRLRWFATPLAINIKLDNLAEGMNFKKYYETWERCPNFEAEYFGKWEGPVASFVRGKGVFLSNRLWARMGDRSRSGLLIHESLRSLQFDDDLPLQDKKIRDFVNALFREDPARASPGYLDGILLELFPVIFSHMPSATKSLAEPLSLVCGINLKGSAPFARNHQASLAAYLRSVAKALPEGAPLKMGADLEATLTKIRHASITAKVLELAGESARPRIQKQRWFEPSAPGCKAVLGFLAEELIQRINRDCPKFRYAERAYSLEPPYAANELLDLQRMVSLTLLQLSQAGQIPALAPPATYSPEFALPSAHKEVKAFRLSDSHLGKLPEVIEAVGGQASFDEIDRNYDAWYWARKDDARHVQFLMSQKLPWPATYPGPDIYEFIQKWRKSQNW